MKKLSAIFIFFSMPFILFSQDEANKLTDLAVPTSPAFILTDNSPSSIQTPNTPKSFVFGLAQSFDKTGNGFPQNYSAEFTPYWWINPASRNVYSLVGLQTTSDGKGGITPLAKENKFSGLKFLSISLGFINKDLIPDALTTNQKIFAIGLRATVLKVHQKGYAAKMNSFIQAWHDKAVIDITRYQDQLSQLDDEGQDSLLAVIANAKNAWSKPEIEAIKSLMSEKPMFSLDFAGAYATYGVNDSTWKSGRAGVWTTISSFLPLDLGTTNPHKNYLNLNMVARYMQDNFYKNEDGLIGRRTSFDLGFKVALEFNELSVGVESIYRYVNGISDSQNRTVGTLNYKIADNIYLNGAFGKNFEVSNKLIALFGINWGFGKEKLNLPAQ